MKGLVTGPGLGMAPGGDTDLESIVDTGYQLDTDLG